MLEEATQRLEYFYSRQELVEELHVSARNQIAVYSARAPMKETDNEDCAGIIHINEEQLVLALADGVGGQPSGQQAAWLAIDALKQAIPSSLEGNGTLREAVLSGFDRANQAVIALGGGAATTLAVTEIDGDIIRTYHVGDSAIMVFGGLGKLKLQTIAHSPVGYAVEAGVIDERDAMGHEDRYLVSNVIGDPGMHVGMSSPLRLRPRDTLLLASDGLYDNVYTDEIVTVLRRGDMQDSVNAIVEKCRKRMLTPVEGKPSKPDDLTLLAYRSIARRRPAARS
jgi:protein phosphatase